MEAEHQKQSRALAVAGTPQPVPRPMLGAPLAPALLPSGTRVTALAEVEHPHRGKSARAGWSLRDSAPATWDLTPFPIGQGNDLVSYEESGHHFGSDSCGVTKVHQREVTEEEEHGSVETRVQLGQQTAAALITGNALESFFPLSSRFYQYLFSRPTQANIKEKMGVIERISRHSQNQRETGPKRIGQEIKTYVQIWAPLVTARQGSNCLVVREVLAWAEDGKRLRKKRKKKRKRRREKRSRKKRKRKNGDGREMGRTGGEGFLPSFRRMPPSNDNVYEEVRDEDDQEEGESEGVCCVDAGIEEATDIGAHRQEGTHTCCHGGGVMKGPTQHCMAVTGHGCQEVALDSGKTHKEEGLSSTSIVGDECLKNHPQPSHPTAGFPKEDSQRKTIRLNSTKKETALNSYGDTSALTSVAPSPLGSSQDQAVTSPSNRKWVYYLTSRNHCICIGQDHGGQHGSHPQRYVTKMQQDIILQQIMSQVANVKKDMIIMKRSKFPSFKAENEKMKLELYQLKQVMDEVIKIRTDTKLDFNVEKSRIKELYSLNKRKLLKYTEGKCKELKSDIMIPNSKNKVCSSDCEKVGHREMRVA
eukprot:bmy_21030T0